jgi:hypothetical protein
MARRTEAAGAAGEHQQVFRARIMPISPFDKRTWTALSSMTSWNG